MSTAARPLRFAAALIFLCAAPGMAQEGSPAPVDEHELHSHEVETFSHTVTVTGSWIPGTPEDAAQPVSVLSRDDLEAEGSPSVLDLIRNLPFSLGADLGSEQFGVRAGADRSSLNLRGLGASRSLILLNGDRLTWSPGAIPDQAQLMVDTNVNPRGGWSGTGRPATFYPLSGAPGIRDPNCKRVGGAVSRPDSPLCRYQYTAFDNLVQDTRRGQWFTEASWDTEGGWRLGAEILLARSEAPSWFTSPSYPPSKGVTGETLWAFRASWSAAERKLEDGDVLDYRLRRALAGLGGLACEDQTPNEHDGDGNLSFSLETLRRHAGRGDCRYWLPFSNSISPHPAVPGVTNPDFDPAFDNGHLFDYLTTVLGTRGETTLFVLEAVASGLLGWALPGGAAEYAVGAQWRGETYGLTPYSIGGAPPRGGALHDIEIYPCPGGPEVTSCDNPEGLFVYLPPAFSTEADRGIGSVFGELSLPLASSLDSQISLRFEDYGGDVGSSLDPKVALRWQATEALALRGSLGTTFRGPTLNQTVSGIADTTRVTIGPIGTATPVHIHGDPALDPESAATFNAGLVVERSGMAGAGSRLFATLDYWRYDFTDPLVIQPFSALVGLACPPADHPLCDPGSPWFDALTISGGEPYDAKGRLNFDTSLARPLPELKGRAFAGYSRGPFTGRWNLNYTGSFLQDAPPPWGEDVPVDARSTHDVHVSCSLPGDRTTLFASILNLADEDPPLIFRPANCDASTHDPLGRVLSIGVRFEL